MSNASYLITVPNMNTITTFFSKISQQTLKVYEIMAKSYFTCLSRPWYLIMVPNMKKIHPATMKECVRMAKWTDGWTDGTGPFPVFPDQVPLRQSGE